MSAATAAGLGWVLVLVSALILGRVAGWWVVIDPLAQFSLWLQSPAVAPIVDAFVALLRSIGG